MTWTEDDHRQSFLEHFEGYYKESSNPLYVWSAIDCCLSGVDALPIPAWCMEYLRTISDNMRRLSEGYDCRKPAGEAPRISPDDANKLVGNALLISRQGSKNAFGKLATDEQEVRAALRGVAAFNGKALSPKRLQSKVARGRRLLRRKPKTSV